MLTKFYIRKTKKVLPAYCKTYKQIVYLRHQKPNHYFGYQLSGDKVFIIHLAARCVEVVAHDGPFSLYGPME